MKCVTACSELWRERGQGRQLALLIHADHYGRGQMVSEYQALKWYAMCWSCIDALLGEGFTACLYRQACFIAQCVLDSLVMPK